MGQTVFEMTTLTYALDVLLQEHRRCSELDDGVDGERVWKACDCWAVVARSTLPPESFDRS